MASQGLRQLLQGASVNTAVRYKQGDDVLAAVTTVSDGFWARIFAGSPAVEGNRHRTDVAGLVALLAEAGIPVESGWERWQPST